MALSMTAMACFAIYDHMDGMQRKLLARAYKPYPIPEELQGKFNPNMVSVIIPTVDTPDTFSRTISTIASNGIKEILIVTTEEYKDHVQAFINKFNEGEGEVCDSIRLFTVPAPNKRLQILRALEESSGDIICLADDDAVWKRNDTIRHLLAPFQEDDIGLTGGTITSYLPLDRQHKDIISPWEVAAIRLRDNRQLGMMAAHAADGSINFCVSGVTMLLRREILTDQAFQAEFKRELWGGIAQNTGDDSFITRWVLFHHDLSPEVAGEAEPRRWRIGIQATPGAVVGTYIARTSLFARQMKRWCRSGLRLRITCLFFQPGFRKMFNSSPYMCFKMVESMLTPFLTLLRLALFYKLCKHYPAAATLYFIWLLTGYVMSLRAFVQNYPFCVRHLWAVIIIDRIYLISDWYCYLTLGKETWMTRNSVA